MLTNELKKGDRVQLTNGWYATIEDNLKGNTRLCTVEGFVTEMGSVYAWDIDNVVHLADETVPDDIHIELTLRQQKARDTARALGF